MRPWLFCLGLCLLGCPCRSQEAVGGGFWQDSAGQSPLMVEARRDSAVFDGRLAHVRVMEITDQMPEMDSVVRLLQDYGKKLSDNLRSMSAEYNAKYKEFQQMEETWPELVKASKERELEELWKRLQDFERQSKEDYAKRSEDMLGPLTRKVKRAIREVAEEGGFSYIFDANNGGLFLGPGAIDVTCRVKAKLGLVDSLTGCEADSIRLFRP